MALWILRLIASTLLDFCGITTGSVTVTERVFRNAGNLGIAVAVTGMSRSLVMPGKANGGLKAEERLAGAAVRSLSSGNSIQ